jgi:putative flippase GtrA
MMDCLRAGYIVSNITAYIIAQVHNFLWCRYWVFPTGGNARFSLVRQVALFTAAFGAAYMGQFLFLVAMVEWLGMNEYLAQFLGLFIYGAINFICNRRLTFSSRQPDSAVNV